MFVDQVVITVRAGRGGDGAISFLREKYVPRGGPAGGTGGNGGSVIFRASHQKKTLYDVYLRRVYNAPSGQPGRGKNQSGKNGDNIVLVVPVGTQIFDQKSGKLLADLIEDGQEISIARGGRGGRGNSSFATAENQAPRIAEKGEPGETREIRLELKLIADVGVSGLPNAGKSTLLSVVSAAKPHIADYPFTTLQPNLGVVAHRDQQFVMVDVPGIIEGASQGAGLGLDFLRHIERTRLILHCVDLSPYTGNNPLSDFALLRHEFEQYSPALAAKPFFVIATKLDIPEAENTFPEFKHRLEKEGMTVYGISAVTRKGIDGLLDAVVEFLHNAPDISQEEPFVSPSESSSGSDVHPRRFRFSTPYLDRLMSEIDWNAVDALATVNQKLFDSGFIKYFSSLRPNSLVEIDQWTFLWTGKKLVWPRTAHEASE